MAHITASRKQLKPDPRYGSLLASKFVNCLMHDGKKSVALGVFYDALDLVKKRIPDKEPIEVFTQALDNVKPSIEVRSKRVGGAAYQVPMQVNRTRQQSLAIRWVLLAVREKKGRAMALKLADDESPRSVEGLNDATWVLMDYGDVIVHVFLAETRAFYDLDRLWADAPVVEWEHLAPLAERA